jgi:hypothetical protein
MKYTIELYNHEEKHWQRINDTPGFNEFDSMEEAELMISQYLDLNDELRVVEFKNMLVKEGWK